VRVLKEVEFYDANETKWVPPLRLTYVNDTTAEVDVTEFLPERTKLQMSHGYWHRADLGRRRRRKKGPTSRRSRP
jgi:hypothetical protein